MPIVSMEPDGELLGSTSRSRVGLGIGPFAKRGLDEAFCLAVGLGRVRPGPDVLEAEILAGVAEFLGAIAGTVVGHDAKDANAETLIVGDSCFEEGDRTLLLLVGENLGEGEPGGVVDANVDELPAGAARLALLWAASDAVTDAFEAAEFLDVDVDQLAGMFPLVAAHWLGGLKGLNAIETKAFEDAADGCRREVDLGGDMLASEELTAKDLDLGGDRGRRRLAQTVRSR